MPRLLPRHAFWLLLVVLVPATPALGQNATGTLHVLVISDTAGTNAESLGFGLQGERLVAVLKDAVRSGAKDRSDQLKVLPALTGDAVTPTNISETIRALKVGSDDAVLVFYSGHGAYDPTEGLYFKLHGADQQVTRKKVLADLASLTPKPRLQVVLSDCCAELRQIKSPRAIPAVPVQDEVPRPLPPPVPPIWPVCEALFYRPRGVVVGTACQDRGVAYALATRRPNATFDPVGMIFCDSFLEVFQAPRRPSSYLSQKVNQETKTADFKKLTWQQFAGWVADETESYASRNDLNQKPKFEFQLTEEGGLPRPRFGATIFKFDQTDPALPTIYRGQSGVVISKVVLGSAAAAAGFQEGDLIQSIDGVVIGDNDAYTAAVAAAGATMTVDVLVYDRNSRTLSSNVVRRVITLGK